MAERSRLRPSVPPAAPPASRRPLRSRARRWAGATGAARLALLPLLALGLLVAASFQPAPAQSAGVTLSATSLTVPEGGSATYTAVLDTAPSHAVTIAVANRDQSADDDDLTVSPASLSFGTSNWNTAQTVTATAAQDSDTADGSAVITHTATSTDNSYNNISIANVTATEDDDDTHGVTLSTTSLSVPEGGSATYTVRLATLPSATVYVDMAKRSGGDGDLTVSPAQLTFTTKGWDLPQRVTVSAAEDNDAAEGAVTITHTATSTDSSYGGITIANVTATEDDDELGVTLSKTALMVPEGGTATWTVVLDGPPTANVTIAVAKKTGGDGNLTVSPASLTFTTSNWNQAQTVTVSAAQDADETDGTATITHTATSSDSGFNGLAIASVTATEDEDDRPGVTVSTTRPDGHGRRHGHLDGSAGLAAGVQRDHCDREAIRRRRQPDGQPGIAHLQLHELELGADGDGVGGRRRRRAGRHRDRHPYRHQHRRGLRRHHHRRRHRHRGRQRPHRGDADGDELGQHRRRRLEDVHARAGYAAGGRRDHRGGQPGRGRRRPRPDRLPGVAHPSPPRTGARRRR